MNWVAKQWYRGKLLGQTAFSGDGGAMFLGEPPLPLAPFIETPPEKFDEALAAILPQMPEELQPTKVCPEEEALVGVGTSRTYCAFFKGGVYVPFDQYEYATEHFPNVQFFFGRGSAPHTRTVICQVGEQIVGVIMPVRYDPQWKSTRNKGRKSRPPVKR